MRSQVYTTLRFPTLGVLIALGALSIGIQYVTMTKLWVLPPSGSMVTLGQYLDAVDQHITFGPLDVLLAALFLLCTALLLYGEARHRALTNFLQDCFAEGITSLTKHGSYTEE